EEDDRFFLNTQFQKTNEKEFIIFSSGYAGKISSEKRFYFRIKYSHGNWRISIDEKSYIFYNFEDYQYSDLIKFLGENHKFYFKK
ncbi:MAG: hypothetical protein ACOCUD_03460, partial [Bacillota bacterium]